LLTFSSMTAPISNIRNVSSSDASKFDALRVLLVDDHTHIRSIITGILNALGITNIVTAERGDVALNFLSNGHFDLLITDYEMPGISGVQLAKLIRKDARSAIPAIDFKVPILMITGNVTRERLHEARDAGIDEILAKPFTVLAVADRLNTVIKKRRDFIICDAYVGPCRRRATRVAYMGPMRRDSDLVELPAFEIEQERTLLLQEAQTLCKLAKSKAILDSGERESVLATALSGAQRSRRISDPLLARAFLSLTIYIQWLPKSAPVESKFVHAHGQAVLDLLDLNATNLAKSEQVTSSLEDMVLRQTSRKRAG
jgi:CheY-like chemotaxis protein